LVGLFRTLLDEPILFYKEYYLSEFTDCIKSPYFQYIKTYGWYIPRILRSIGLIISFLLWHIHNAWLEVIPHFNFVFSQIYFNIFIKLSYKIKYIWYIYDMQTKLSFLNPIRNIFKIMRIYLWQCCQYLWQLLIYLWIYLWQCCQYLFDSLKQAAYNNLPVLVQTFTSFLDTVKIWFKFILDPALNILFKAIINPTFDVLFKFIWIQDFYKDQYFNCLWWISLIGQIIWVEQFNETFNNYIDSCIFECWLILYNIIFVISDVLISLDKLKNWMELIIII